MILHAEVWYIYAQKPYTMRTEVQKKKNRDQYHSSSLHPITIKVAGEYVKNKSTKIILRTPLLTSGLRPILPTHSLKRALGSNSHHFHNLQNNWRNQVNVILPIVGRKKEEEGRKEQNLKEKKAVECYLQTASEQADGWSWTCAYARCTLSLSYLRRCNWLPLLLPLLRILATSYKTKRGKQKTRIRENSALSRNPPYPQTLTLKTLILQTPEKYRVAHPSHPIIPQMEDLDHRMVHHLSHA